MSEISLNFLVNHQKISYVDQSSVYVRYDRGDVVTATFEFFGTEWSGVAKLAIFTNDIATIHVLLDENGSCTVPSAILESSTWMNVSAYGGSLITVGMVRVNIVDDSTNLNYTIDTTDHIEATDFAYLITAGGKALRVPITTLKDYIAGYHREDLAKEMETIASQRWQNSDRILFWRYINGEPEIVAGTFAQLKEIVLDGVTVSGGNDFDPNTYTVGLPSVELADGLKFPVQKSDASGMGKVTLADLKAQLATGGHVTPEMYGAYGDGQHDDAPALKRALESGSPVVLTQDLYIKSNIEIVDHDVWLDGCGHALHVIGSDMLGYMAKGRCIYIHSQLYNGIEEGADVVMYTEDEQANPVFANSAYHRGYISYHGINPTPTHEVYTNYTTRSWFEHRVVLLNLDVKTYDCGGMTVVAIFRTCRSQIKNCHFEVMEGDANVGLRVLYSYALQAIGNSFIGFNAMYSRHVENTGYGMQFGGDACLVSNTFARDCKHGLCVGGDAQYFATGIVITDFVSQIIFTDDYASNNQRVYQQVLDLHEGIHRPTVSNVWVELDNATDPELIATVIMVSCPECTLNNIHAQHANQGYQRGFIGFGPESRKCQINGLYAPMCRIYGYGWRHERGNMNDANFFHELWISGGEIGDIRCCDGDIHVHLDNVRVNGYIAPMRYLYANNCKFKMVDYSGGGRLPISITGEGWFTHCDIYSNLRHDYKRSMPVIDAPANSLHMVNCIIHKQLDRVTFKTEQTHVVNCEVYDLWGLVLGSSVYGRGMDDGENPYYVEGDQCVLDSYNLW